MNPIFISLTALAISMASFALALFQFSRNQRIKKLEKINETVAGVFDLRRSSEELQKLIDVSDDIGPHEEIFKQIHLFTENAVGILNSPRIKTTELYHAEQALLKNRLEFDLFAMEIDEQIRFNKELYDYEQARRAN